MDILTHFENEEKIKEYINACETRFKKEISLCVHRLTEDRSLRFITLGGPSCSGKTTAAHIIVDALENAGRSVKVVSIDDFFLERELLNRREILDYDSVETIDLELLKQTVDLIENGESVNLPKFDFVTGSRTGYTRYDPMPESITVFEGIQAVYPEIVSLFDKNDTRSIYISVAQDMCFDDITVDARTVRLLRRLVRDCKKRGTAPEFTLTLWESVCANEDKSILPYKDGCDFKLDSLLGYELSLLKTPALALLAEIEKDSVHSTKARELESLLSRVCAVDALYVPKDSLFNEFI
ncbi:MAG: hypothetical protein IJ391_09425 [Clostridia bacterium]|nr:hypothetical protein [Clostridia bacterium]